ncbi:ParB/RepB/Spo0J family partition protein [Streptomyces sp. NPDC089424]|uniref:ParB/RepB/Spo0J family partition protein n=1 Tax=Streptomyces sp. NPDC089424 TaxID=3365917 RepID=UPI0038158B20
MSKAETLGPAPSFGAVRSARRNAIRSIGGEDTTAAITELPVTVISDNPDNPRNHLRNLDDTVEAVREVGIILPIVVATVDAYLRDRPDRGGDLDDGAQYVVVDGHRRLEASRRVGLAIIPVRVDNSRVATDEALLEAAFIANVHRDDMTDLEEAHALKQLVEYYGSQIKASKRLGISQANISSKLSLLKLAPELQKDLMTGERKVEHVRNLGKLSPQEQKAKADERAEAARQKPEPRPASVVERAAGPADYHGVIIPETSPAAPAGSAAPAAGQETPVEVPEPTTPPSKQSARPTSVPAQAATPEVPALSAESATPARFPYDNPGEACMFLEKKASWGDYLAILHNMMLRASELDPDTYQEIVDEVAEKRSAPTA